MSSRAPTSRRSPADLKGQAKVIYEVQRCVDAWRGFALGRAADAYPTELPRYAPTADGERALTETSLSLLRHWFRHDPHTRDGAPAFKYWPHQRRLVETFIYLYEVRGFRRTDELYRLAGVEPLGPQRDPWAKLGGQLATGSGKTKMMSLLIAWSYLNAVCEPSSSLGLGRHCILIAPGLFVRDRLLQDFRPERGPSVFLSDPVIPPELETLWDLKVYRSDDCPMTLDPAEAVMVVTNYHQLLRARSDAPEMRSRSDGERQLDIFFEDGDPERLESIRSPLIERFSQSQGLLVLNDEAHHVWDETGHARFEQKAEQQAKLGNSEEAEVAQAWIRSIRRLNGDDPQRGRVGLQVDLSATLFEEVGATRKTSGGKESVEFKPADLFRHTVVHYGLAAAITDGIVKKPVLERVVVKNKTTGEPEELVRAGQPNAWEKYRNLLITGIERWKKVAAQFADEGDTRKPILFVLCNDRKEAREITNFLTYGEADSGDLESRSPTGWLDPKSDVPLFLEKDADGQLRSTVIEIHIGKKEESNELEWEKVRQAVNAIDHDEIPDPAGRRDEVGRPIMLRNPYNVVVSVMMLKEGWDVRNVKVIVPTRPCDSRTLTEQALGRGLRKMHPAILDDEGVATVKNEELYVIEHPSFRAIIEQIKDIVEERASDEIEHAREYVPILQSADEVPRTGHDVRLLRFDGFVETAEDWRENFDMKRVGPLAPKVSWSEELAETEIRTFLQAALALQEETGQTFTLPANPSYRDFTHVLELAYVVPLLKDLRTSHQHKTAVRGIVQEFLETKTFALPMGLPLSFDKVIESGNARIALGNLARSEVIERVRQAVLGPLREAFTAQRRSTQPVLTSRSALELRNYQALKRNVFDTPQKTTFLRAAMDSNEELRLARLLDRAPDVTGWLYNHRSGVGYAIPYDWQDHSARYYPDFVARAKFGVVFHNLIIEVKGRLDDRDKVKARRGRRWCELLAEHDKEPWHYLLLIENAPAGREDITWWEERSSHAIAELLRRHESLPLLPEERRRGAHSAFKVVESVAADEQFREALPVYDLGVAAGLLDEAQTPTPIGWARVDAATATDRQLFLARVMGESMAPGISHGTWGLFRGYPRGMAPSAAALDGRRVVVQLSGVDSETGNRSTLKRCFVTKLDDSGRATELELRPDNGAFKTRRLSIDDSDASIVAEFLESIA